MFKSRPQPADLLSQILMKPPNNSRHLMSANCPIEVIRHQHLQIKSRPCCHLHQATKHALFQRPPGTCPIPIFTPPYIISIPQRIFQYCQVELRLQIHSSRRVFPAADLMISDSCYLKSPYCFGFIIVGLLAETKRPVLPLICSSWLRLETHRILLISLLKPLEEGVAIIHWR
jgi:hypothetical protein